MSGGRINRTIIGFIKDQKLLLIGVAIFIILVFTDFGGSSDDNTLTAKQKPARRVTAQQETTQQATTQEGTTQQATTQQATTQQATAQQATTQQATTQQATTQQATTQQATTQQSTTINPVQSDDDDSLDKNMITNEEIMCASCGYVGIAPDTKDACDKCGCNWTDNKTPRCQLN